jgi:hypothetical protein
MNGTAATVVCPPLGWPAGRAGSGRSLQKWPEDFPGFRATLRFCAGLGEGRGSVECAPGGHAAVEVTDPTVRDVAFRWLSEVARERTPHLFKDRDGRYRVSLEEAEEPPLVWRVRVHHPDGA